MTDQNAHAHTVDRQLESGAKTHSMGSAAPAGEVHNRIFCRRFLCWVMTLLTLAILVIAGRTATAHNMDLHERLVSDAFTYIKQSGTATQRAALAELARVAGSEDKVRSDMADEAKQTDKYEDLALFSNSKMLAPFVPFITGDRTFFQYDGHYITRLQHFVNVTRAPEQWKGREGYFYQWSSKQDEDKQSMAAGWAARADLEVDDEYSIALPRYQTHWNGSDQQWARNWEYKYDPRPGGDDWDVENTRFAPASVVGYYWFRRYVEYPAEDARTQFGKYEMASTPVSKQARSGRHIAVMSIKPRKINQARLLGPALHVAADVTVPHHVLGASGYGHQAYEDDFETLYNRGILRVTANGVTDHLRNRDFLQWGLSPASAQPDMIDTLQVVVVTGDQDGDGTDADVNIDFGPGQHYDLNTPMDDFERWNDDTFTLRVRPNTKVADLRRLRISRGQDGSPWRLKAIYVVVNGVLLYGNGHVDKVLRSNDSWTANDFVPRATIDNQVWAIDSVLNRAAEYTFAYTAQQIGAANMRNVSFWNANHSSANGASANQLSQRISRMQHLLDLAVANIVRVIEMSQVDRRS